MKGTEKDELSLGALTLWLTVFDHISVCHLWATVGFIFVVPFLAGWNMPLGVGEWNISRVSSRSLLLGLLGREIVRGGVAR